MGAALYGDDLVHLTVALGGVHPFEHGDNQLREVAIAITSTPGATFLMKPQFHTTYFDITDMTEIVTQGKYSEYHEWTMLIAGFKRPCPGRSVAVVLMRWAMSVAANVTAVEPKCQTTRMHGAKSPLPYHDISPHSVVRLCPGTISMQWYIQPALATEYTLL